MIEWDSLSNFNQNKIIIIFVYDCNGTQADTCNGVTWWSRRMTLESAHEGNMFYIL